MKGRLKTMARRKNEEVENIEMEISKPEDDNIVIPEKTLDHPKLHDWIPTEEDEFFIQDGASIIAKYERLSEIGYREETLCTYLIVLQHFVSRMPDILKHMNYFIKYYDPEDEFLMSYLSLKFIIDTKAKIMTSKTLKSYILNRIMTESFMDNIQRMVDDLYTINIDTDKGGNYRSTPKITNEHAKVILAVSFTIRLLMPACIHFSNVCPAVYSTPDNKKKKTGYISCFVTIFMAIIRKFEKRTIPIYGAICKFVEYRVNKRSNSDALMLEKKKQIHGDNLETYLSSLIHEVLIVKSLYKIDYEQSVVSYFDGIIMKNYKQFKSEKFKNKPVELSSDDAQKDNKDDDFLSHAEALEMSIYRVDETNPILTKANSSKVLEQLRRDFNIPIDQDELDFYDENVNGNDTAQKLLHMFYSNFFHDSTAINLIPREDIIYLLVVLKKFLQMKGMVLLPQICTATVRGKYKENTIRNRRFTEKYESSAIFQHELKEKLKYVEQLNPKESPPRKILSTMINSTFIWVDYDPEINGKENSEIDIDTIIHEYEMFLLLI